MSLPFGKPLAFDGDPELSLVADEQHYQLLREVVLQARFSLWLTTATLKETRIADPGFGYGPILRDLARLAANGCDIRILHGSEPSRAFQQSWRDFAPAIALRHNPRVHCKLILVDGYQAYIGSANLTGAGLGAKSDHHRNHELGFFARDVELAHMLMEYFLSIWDNRKTGSSPCMMYGMIGKVDPTADKSRASTSESKLR